MAPNEAELVVGGGWAIPLPGRRLSRTSIDWPFGRLVIDSTQLTFSAVRPFRGRVEVVVRRDELIRVERCKGISLAARMGLLRFRTTNPQNDRIAFTSFPKRVRAVEAKLAALGVTVSGSEVKP
jgi:hypothetical protein